MTPRDLRYEESRVDMVLDAFVMREYRRMLLEAGRTAYGRPRLTFEVFLQIFPTFPVRLEARHLGRFAERCKPADLLRRISWTPVFDPIRAAYARAEAAEDPRPVGVAIPFDGLKGGAVVHTAEFVSGGNRLIVESPDGYPPYKVYVERFATFLRFLARTTWTPTSGPVLVSQANSMVAPSAVIHPWMVKLVGTGPGLVVWGWVMACFAFPTAGASFLRRVSNKELAVAATYAEIAAATGLAEEQVKRGLKALRDAGVIATERREGRTSIYLTPENFE